MYTIPIIMLHGLGSHTVTLDPMRMYLIYKGFNNIHNIQYDIESNSLDTMVKNVSASIDAIGIDQSSKIILIGQSMGGVVANNLHKHGWDIHLAIYIGSPLHGARLISQLEYYLPKRMRNSLYQPAYDILKSKSKEQEPPHPYKTITMSWIICNTFDGCVYKDEAVIDEEHNIHLKWADHRTIFANPRLWYTVGDVILSTLDKNDKSKL